MLHSVLQQFLEEDVDNAFASVPFAEGEYAPSPYCPLLLGEYLASMLGLPAQEGVCGFCAYSWPLSWLPLDSQLHLGLCLGYLVLQVFLLS